MDSIESLAISEPAMLNVGTVDNIVPAVEPAEGETPIDTPEKVNDAAHRLPLNYQTLDHQLKQIRLLTLLDGEDDHHVHCTCMCVFSITPLFFPLLCDLS